MNRTELFYLLPYFFPLAISTGVLIYTWERRESRGVRAYTWLLAGEILTILGFIFELITPTLAIKILWDKFQWVVDSLVILPAAILFSVQFAEYRLQKPKLTWAFWLSMPAIFITLLLTDGIHHQIYPDPHLSADFPFPELEYSFTLIVYLYVTFYIYGANLFAIWVLIRRGMQSSNLYRGQCFIVAAGFLIPLSLSVFSLADIKIAPQRDLTPFGLTLGNIVVIWGLFRYGMFDIMPIARERTIENLSDPVVVLDATNRVMDVNISALISFGGNYSEIVGQPALKFFARWPEIREMVMEDKVRKREISVQGDFDTLFYDINITDIFDRTQKLMGRIMIAHDVTKFKALEISYRMLSQELEDRVKQQTQELIASEEKFSKAFQASPDGIILAELETGRLIEVNAGFEKIFGYTRNEIIGKTVMDLNIYVDAADRQALTSKLKEMGYIHNMEFSARDKFGEEHIIQVSAELVEIEGTQHIVTVNHDITEEIKRVERQLQQAYDTTLEGWASALELRDKDTEGHSWRVTETTLIIAKTVGFSEDELIDIRRGALLHDIGKMAVPDEILRKKGPLDERERRIVNTHPQVAYDLLVKIPHLNKALEIPYYHHEKWDGSGYPQGLAGAQIPLTARIFSVVDVWDALSNDRPYRAAWDQKKVIEYLRSNAGKHFDPEIVHIFVQLINQGRI